MTAIQDIEQRLNQLRATLAQAERWSPAWFEAWMQSTHLEAEISRRSYGLFGACGCDLCRNSGALPQAETGVTKVKSDTGRPPVPLSKARLLELNQEGLGIKRIAELMGVSHMTISRRLVVLSLGQSSEGAGVAQHSTALCSREPS